MKGRNSGTQKKKLVQIKLNLPLVAHNISKFGLIRLSQTQIIEQKP